MSTSSLSKFVLILGACTALTACQTSQSTSNIQTSGTLDSAIVERAAVYDRSNNKSPKMLERAYKKNPSDETTAVDYAAALREAGFVDRADLILEPFAKDKMASSLVTSEYAAVKLASGNYEAAEKYAQKAIIADDANFKAYHRLGIALDAQGMHEEGERAYRKGLELWQGDPTSIMNNLALNLASQGFLTESVEILRKAQDVSPNKVEIERNLRIVTALQQAEGAPAPKPRKKPVAPVMKAPEPAPVVEEPEPVTEVKVEVEAQEDAKVEVEVEVEAEPEPQALQVNP